VVVDDLDVVRVPRSPAETDPPLLVDADTVLAGSIALQLLQPVAGWDPQVVQHHRSVQHPEFPQRDSLNIGAQLPNRLPVEEAFSVAVSEALDHAE
jgi:hypothetical protein